MVVMLRRKIPAFKPPGRTSGRAFEDSTSRTQPPSPAGRPDRVVSQAEIDVNRLVWDTEYRDEIRRRLKACG
jgi:hypothetical protein